MTHEPRDPLPCALLSCFLERHAIEMCKAERCCYLHLRDRREREERDRRENEGGE